VSGCRSNATTFGPLRLETLRNAVPIALAALAPASVRLAGDAAAPVTDP
jgi:hypothetical protein